MAFQALGFIGLGVMGAPMCTNLVAKSGLPVWGFDHDPAASANVPGDTFKSVAKIAEVSEQADVVFLSLPAIQQVTEVCREIFRHPGRVKYIVDMSTSAVSESRQLAEEAKAHGISFVDAPVARLREAARNGTLSIMVGGTAEQFQAMQRLLACMGSDVTHCGPVGCGQVVKILNNMTVHMTVHTLAEVITIGRRAGIDGKVLLETMALGSADSFALRNVGLKFLALDHFPTKTFPTEYAIKDFTLAMQMAQEGGVAAKQATGTLEMLKRTRDAGFGKEYYPILVRMVEKDSRPVEGNGSVAA